MKILVVSNMYPDEKHPSYGVFVKNFCEQLGMLGIDHSRAVMYKSDSKIGKIVNYITFYLNVFFSCLFGNHDLVYVHYASNSSIPVLWAQRIRKNVIYTNVHGSDVVPENEKQENLQKYTREVLKCSKKIIVPSEYFKNYVSEKYGITEEIIYVVHSGGVNAEVFYKENTEKLEENILKLGYVGRVSHGKGWDTMIEACAQLEDVDYKLVIVGSGPKESELNYLIEKYGVVEHIERYQLLSQEELRKVYNQIDVFLFPTEREGESLGLVAIEAMACGTPVIASDFAAPADYVIDGVNGFKFEKENPSDLANKVRQFNAYTQIEKEKMCCNALETAKLYSVERILKQMQKVFEE